MRFVRVCAFLMLLPAFVLAAGSDLRLIEAVRGGDTETVRALLQQNVPITATEADGTTALHLSVQSNDLNLTDLLVAAGADVNTPTRYNITPLSLACTNGNAAIIERLLKAGADPNGTSEEGQTVLMTAALTGKVDAIKLLLARGANVNVQEPNRGQSALMWAASEGNAAAVELLIEFGAEVQAKSKSEFTPLLFAVRNGHTGAARVLLAHGANANDAALDGTSSLNMAVVNAYFEVAALLLDHGADPNAPDARGSALHTLAWLRRPGSDGGTGLGRRSYGPPLPTGNVSSLELAKALLEHGANPNVRIDWEEKGPVNRDGSVQNPPLIRLGRHYLTYRGATPFYLAAKHADTPYMKLLAEYGADPKMPNVLGVTPLMVASGLDYWEGESPGPFTGVPETERLEAVRLAIDLGNDINAAADFSADKSFEMEGDPEYLLLYFPLNFEDLFKTLLSDPRWSGSTALHGAVVSNQPGIVAYLVAHGAKLDAKTTSGWTPLMMAEGVFFANARKDFPAAAAILKKAMSEHGLIAAGSAR